MSHPAGFVRPGLSTSWADARSLIYVEAGDEKSVLICFEEGLRHRGLGAVVAEVARLSMTAPRRLQLAAEGSGTVGLAIRRWRRPAEAADFGQPTASVTRWRVSALPSTPLPVPGVGRARWQLELIRCRARESADFEVEACEPRLPREPSRTAPGSLDRNRVPSPNLGSRRSSALRNLELSAIAWLVLHLDRRA